MLTYGFFLISINIFTMNKNSSNETGIRATGVCEAKNFCWYSQYSNHIVAKLSKDKATSNINRKVLNTLEQCFWNGVPRRLSGVPRSLSKFKKENLFN